MNWINLGVFALVFVLMATFAFRTCRKTILSIVSVGRREAKLRSACKNITGRVERALQSGIDSNHQWGHRLEIFAVPNLDEVRICVYDSLEVGEKRMVTEMSVGITDAFVHTPTVRITRSFGINTKRNYVQTTDPNNLDLVLLIENQMNFLQNWMPISKAVS